MRSGGPRNYEGVPSLADCVSRTRFPNTYNRVKSLFVNLFASFPFFLPNRFNHYKIASKWRTSFFFLRNPREFSSILSISAIGVQLNFKKKQNSTPRWLRHELAGNAKSNTCANELSSLSEARRHFQANIPRSSRQTAPPFQALPRPIGREGEFPHRMSHTLRNDRIRLSLSPLSPHNRRNVMFFDGDKA